MRATTQEGQHDSLSPKHRPPVRPDRDSFPVSIVWCPIIPITWILPFVGHLGIVSSDGIIHDFIGPFTINKDEKRLGFGPATKYYPIELSQLHGLKYTDDWLTEWDRTIEESDHVYEGKMHDLLCNNCHSHVAYTLNALKFEGFSHWNTLFLIYWMFFKAKFVSRTRLLVTFIGFFIIFCIVLLGIVFLGSTAIATRLL